jgi:outer membrane protein assembly factor BamD
MLNYSNCVVGTKIRLIFAGMSMLIRFSFAFLGAILLYSCGEYSKITKSDNYEEKISKAESLYESKSYNRALPLYEQIYNRFPREGRGELAYYRLAKIYYAIEDYYMAGYYFGNFVTRFPFSAKAEECLFMSAMCSVKLSPEPSLDQEETQVALNELQLFVNRYPESPLVDSCNSVMDQLRIKLETKDFLSVKLYARTERYKAAVVSAKSFIEEHPQSQYREEAAFIILENAFILASNSIFSRKKERLEDVIEIYNSYRSDLDKRRYKSRADDFYKRAGEMLKSVDEEVAYNDLMVVFKKTNTESIKKKIDYLEETIQTYRKFAAAYPQSSFLKKATDIFEKAEKELKNLK